MIGLERIAERQREYFHSGATRGTAARKKALKTLVELLRREGDAIAEAIGKDLGRCWMEAWNSEPGLVLGDIRYALRHLTLWNRSKLLKPSPLMIPGFVRSAREPFGTAVVIGPWNYPAGLLLAPMVSALAGGNTVILKPSERAPETASVIKKLIGEYFDEQLAAVVTGGGAEASWLVRNSADIVCFTGSGTTGKKVLEDAASRPIPVVLELGGANPCYVDHDANLKEAAKRIAWGKFFAAGQTCMAPNHVFVHESVFKDFLGIIARTVKDFYGENPKDSADYGRIIDETAWDRLQPFMEMGTLVCGGYGNREDLFVAPTVIHEPDEDSPLLSTEIFGPILPVTPCGSIEKAMTLCGRGDDSPLSAYGFSRNFRRMEKLLELNVRTGSITVNGTIHRIVSSSIGFGGVGGSGFNRYRGKEGYRNFTWERVSLKKCAGMEMPFIYPPYKVGRKFVRMLGRFI